MAIRSSGGGWVPSQYVTQAGGSGSERLVVTKRRSSATALSGSPVAWTASQSASAS